MYNDFSTSSNPTDKGARIPLTPSQDDLRTSTRTELKTQDTKTPQVSLQSSYPGQAMRLPTVPNTIAFLSILATAHAFNAATLERYSDRDCQEPLPTVIYDYEGPSGSRFFVDDGFAGSPILTQIAPGCTVKSVFAGFSFLDTSAAIEPIINACITSEKTINNGQVLQFNFNKTIVACTV
jgi:hypothetical protein